MLHHIGIELQPTAIDRAVEFFTLLGFEQVESPPTLAEYTWLECEGTQIHLMPESQPTVPSRGHLAVVVADFEATLEHLREHGFEVEARRAHWGAARAHATAPGGHRVELMAAAPRGGAM